MFIATDLKKYTSYENEIKKLCKSKVVTSGVTTSSLSYSFCFSDKLQNYHNNSEAGQNPRCSIAFY